MSQITLFERPFQEQVKAFRMAEVELHYRNKMLVSDMPKITSSTDAVSYLRSIWSVHIERIEEFMAVCLNRANRVLGWSKISSGGISGTVADPRVIFQIGLKSNASSIILAHNHPSGNKEPSQSDIALTHKLRDAGNTLDIQVLDHIILTSESFYSCADEGII